MRQLARLLPLQNPASAVPARSIARCRERNQVEQFINRLKQFRRVATRYEKRTTSYLAMVTPAATVLWL
jgi:transposase